ncbi:MAG: peroxide stress protein YaaA [Ekhidna sp.]|nr:peroxide stress protein YaaA [Ekhidna sp.]
MIAILSPAKNLEAKLEINFKGTQPRLMECTRTLIEVMRKKSVNEVSELMCISRSLAELNVSRYSQFDANHTEDNAEPSALFFNGDVYQGLKAETFDEQKMAFAQRHLRILSGLYGLLRPLDLIQPYRLEMGTKLAFDNHKTLYEYWGGKILNLLLEDLKQQGDDIIINLASNEYFKSIDLKGVPAKIVDVVFKDFKGGKYKVISFYAKRARGLMARYIIENQINKPESLRGFDYEGYYFDPEASSDSLYTFRRERK